MHEIEVVVSGKVQNVGFREFVHKHANALWLQGFVQNQGFGELRVVAQGPEDKLKRLIEHLHKGPFLAHVRDAQVEWRELSKKYTDFSIV